MMHSVALRFASKTDTGAVRSHNEDAIEVNVDDSIAVLADGMGGYNAGEVASRIAVSVFRSTLEQGLQRVKVKRSTASCRFLQRLMSESVALANAQILEEARLQPEFSGMGTTLVAALFDHDRVVLAHVGDSRAYRLRQGALQQITRDHSLLQEQIDAGLVSPAWARYAPNKNLITRALGVEQQVETEINHYRSERGDVYLLCSDGLSDMVTDEQIAMILNRDVSDLDGSCEALIQAANNNGGRDNISVVLIRVETCTVLPVSWPDRLVLWWRRLRQSRV